MNYSFFWRPENSQVREDITFTMKSTVKDHDLNGKQVTLTEQMSGLDDEGELNDSLSDPDYGGEFVQFVKKTSLQQPYYSKTTKAIYSELKKQGTSNIKMDRKPENSVEPELVDFEENSTLTSIQWYKQQVNDNKTNKDKNRQAFSGYYLISPQQALEKGAVYFRINFVYNVTGKENERTDIKGRKILDHILSKINSKKIPDGKYMVGFDVKDEEGTKGSISNLKYFQV